METVEFFFFYPLHSNTFYSSLFSYFFFVGPSAALRTLRLNRILHFYLGGNRDKIQNLS